MDPPSMKRLLLLTLLLGLTKATSFAETPPNILLILTDDHGWSQLSAPIDPRRPEAVSEYLETPNINRIMEEGMRFTSGYSPAPLCTPTRRSILCGTSAARSGTEFKSSWIPAEHMTIPKALALAHPDYRCGHFGKWGEQMISTPEEAGYDVSDGETGNGTGGMPNTLGIKGGHGDGPPHFIDNEDPKRSPSMTGRTIAFMKEQVSNGNPFYAQASFYAQHLSVVCAEETLAKYEAKGAPDRGYTPAWAAMMEELDTAVGHLLDSLEELGVADNTYVFFTTDNGGRGTVPGGVQSNTATNFPLTGAKHSLYEGGIRVPFMVRGPGIEPGSVSHVPVVGYDFLPTFFDLAGGTESLTDTVDGVSFRSLLEGAEAPLDRNPGGLIFHRPGKYESAFRDDTHKLMLTWTEEGEISERRLYRVDTNPVEEGFNIAAENPELVATLEKKLLDYLDIVDAEKPMPKPNRKNKKKTP